MSETAELTPASGAPEPSAPPSPPPASGRSRWILAAALFALLAAVGSALVAYEGARRGSRMLSVVPSGAVGFLAVDWKRVADSEGFEQILGTVDLLLRLSPRAHGLYERSRVDLRAIEAVVVAMTFEGGRESILAAARGTFDRAAIGGVLEEAGLAPRKAGDLTVYEGPGRSAAVAFLEDDLLAVAPPSVLQEMAALSRGRGRSLADAPLARDLLARIDRSALVVAAIAPPPPLGARLARRVGARMPDRLAVSIDGRDGVADLRGVLVYADDARASAARGWLESLLHKGREAAGSAPPVVREMLSSLLGSVRIEARGKVVEVRAKARLLPSWPAVGPAFPSLHPSGSSRP